MLPPPDAGQQLCMPAEIQWDNGILQRCAGNGQEWGVDTDGYAFCE
jgi:hypothetical protein